MVVFKAYDIRGIYGTQITEELFYNIGKNLCVLGEIKNVVIGYDMRNSSIPLSEALIAGARDSGINVINLKLASTPMVYHATSIFDVDLGLVITASHNSKEFNGLKICRKNAYPISFETGLNRIKEAIEQNESYESNSQGTYEEKEGFREQYYNILNSYGKPNREIKIVFDAGNGMGGFIDFDILKNYAKIIPLYTNLDGAFPNHEANPIKEENLIDLSKKVIEAGADFGVAFDGDADRIGVVDERGEYIGADYVGAFLIEEFIKKFPNENTYSFDLRSTMSVKELIDRNNKRAIKTKVGHSYIKDIMRKEHSFFSMELSGHFYFWFDKDLVYDSSIRATIELLNAYSSYNSKLSDLISKYKKYFKSSEINFRVENKEMVLEKIKNEFNCFNIEEIDGITISNEDFWANIRASNTENLLRLNLEAKKKEDYEKYMNKISFIIENKNI